MDFLRRIRLPILAAVCLLAPAGSAFGQAVYGSIFGTVTDATGAVIPGATIIITDEGKGTSVTLTSNESGEFTGEHLIPDLYDVKVTAPNFQAYETKGLTLLADTALKIEASLKIGDAGQTIEVSADSIPLLKTDRADVSTTFEARQIEDLPIGDRNFTNLQLLLPGAQQLGWAHAADENPQGSKQIDVDGQAFGGVAFQLDGTDNQDPILGIIVINPNIDSLSESKITTQNFDAEFGKAVSSVMTAQTKSGSNSFHGSAFDYRESAANLARDPFTQSKAAGVPGALKNQFGGSLGGPILRDKAFFFVDYQGVRQKVGTSALQTVPTAQVITSCLSGTGCDFSQYPVQIYNNQPATLTTPAGNGAPFPNNLIPDNLVSPQAKALLKILQPYAPNNSSDASFPGLRNNYSGNGTGLFNSDQYDIRGDYQVSPNTHAFGRFSRFTDTLTGGTLFGPAGGNGFGLGNYGGNSTGANDSVAAGVDIAINSKLLTDIRAGYYKYHIIDAKYDQSVDFATSLGIPGENLGGLTGGAPSFEIAEVGSTGNISTAGDSQGQGPQYGAGLNVDHCNCPLNEDEDQFQLVNNWTKTIGNHSVKFGVDLRYARNLRVPSDNDRTGVNQFGTGPTSDPALKQPGGLGFATFVLGDVTAYNRYASQSTNAKEFQKRDFFYAQDTWRASQKLTLNLGLRYELYFPESVNAQGAGSVENPSTGYFQVAGYGNLGSDMGYKKTGNPYNPRIGAAYQLNDKMVIRAGYGRSFDLGVFGSLFGHVATQDLPVLVNQQLSTTTGQTGDVFALANGPAAPYFNAVPSNGLLPAPGYEVSPKSRPITMRLPTIDAWNFSVQQSITPTLSLTMAYVGNKGTHTLSAGDGNNTNPNEAAITLPAQYSLSGTQLHYDPNGGNCLPAGPNCTPSGLAGGAKVGTLVNAGGGTSNTTLLQRYYGGNLPACSDPVYTAQAATYTAAVGGANPLAGLPAGSCGWSNSIGFYGDDQDSHYNALQISVAKTLTHGYSLNANYAWQRAYDWNPSYATWDRSAVKGRNGAIREQQVIVYGLFELPFGRNHLILPKANTLVNEIIGGWQFSPVFTYSGGAPFTLSYGECNSSIPGDAPCYVNGDPKSLKKHVTGFPGSPTGLSFYDKVTLGGIFTAPGLDQIGDSGRDSAFGPHYFNGDLSLQKNFPVWESVVAQFRADAFNGFNHINFNTPNGNIEQGGSITNGPGPSGTQLPSPRQLQLSVRVQF
jgi:outer membrane receptor protein involved in Fe transport